MRLRASDRSGLMCRRVSRRRPVSKIARGFARCSRVFMASPVMSRRDPDARGYFGAYGGRFVPETLVEPVEELERAYFAVRDDEAFAADLNRLLKDYVGRP